MKTNKLGFLLLLLFSLVLIVSCGDDDGPSPDDDHEGEEEINKVVLTFTPDNGEDAVVATWLDVDGAGVGSVPTIDDIVLAADTEYDMTITLTNTLGMEDEDITPEIAEEDEEHQFFFEFPSDLFTNPAGDGNIDQFDDPLNYNDEDSEAQDGSGNPVGLSTKWTTGGAANPSEKFRIMLRHLADDKTANSTADDGGEDLDIEFQIEIQ